MLNCCIEHKKKREQLHKGYTGDLDSPPSSPYRGPSTSQVSRSLSHDDPLVNQVESSAIENDRRTNQAKMSGNQSESGAKRTSQYGAIKNKIGSLRPTLSGESSDEDEFFECNDEENNQSAEKDEDTSENQSADNQTDETQNQSEETLQKMATDEVESVDNEANQSETEMECETVNTSHGSSLNASLTDSQIREITGSEQRQSVSNISVVSDSAYKESYSHRPEGRLAPFQGLKLINCDEKMYIPVTQEPAPMTEDMLEEHAEVLAK